MDKKDYIIDKTSIKHSIEFKEYIYVKYLIYSFISIFLIIATILLFINIRYIKGIKSYENKNYEESLRLLSNKANFRNSNKYLRNISYENLSNFKVGDTIYLGTYDNQIISWIILDIVDDKYLITTKGTLNAIDDYAYWEDSNIRYILNNEFYYKVFNDKEKSIILNTITYENISDDLIIDKIFILEREVSEKYGIYEYDINYIDERNYNTDLSIYIKPTMWISKNNKHKIDEETLKLYYKNDFEEMYERDIYKTQIGMYDYLLKDEDNKICYYWLSSNKKYYACVEEIDGKRIVTDENIDRSAIEDILEKRKGY